MLLKDLQGNFVDEDDLQFSFTDENGKTQLGEYYYYTEETLGADGWYDQDFNFINDTQYLTWGQGVWFISADGPKNITTAGEVLKGHKIHTVTDPKTLVSSAYPVPFCPNAASVTWPNAQDEDDIQYAFTDENGKTQLGEYYYYTEATLGADGWYDQDFNLLDADTAIVGVGEGFWYIPVDPATASFCEVSPLGDEVAK